MILFAGLLFYHFIYGVSSLLILSNLLAVLTLFIAPSDSKILIDRNKFFRQISNGIVSFFLIAVTHTIALAWVRNTLPLPNWAIHEITSKQVYWLTFFHQSYIFVIVGVIDFIYDSIIICLMLNLCTLLEILESRVLEILLFNAKQQYRVIVKIVNNHNLLLR